MLSDKKIVVADPARRMGRACTLASARGFKLKLARSALAAAVASLLPLYAVAQVGQGAAPAIEVADTVRDFDLPAGSLEAALEAFGSQSGIRLDLRPGLLADKQARAVSGRMDWRQALGELLQGSGLEYQQTGDTTVVIATVGKDAASADEPARARPETTTPQAATTLEAVTVTGTRIRGGTTPSPVITIGSEQIREEGFSDLGEVIRSVPQNHAGGQNPEVPAGNLLQAGIANQNVTGGSGLNLRGLGPDATLTLLNGRRMSHGGFSQALDISAIPVAAVDRVEIVPDGSSAIYGSDAVGGVGNVILRRDFDGVTLGVRHGAATEGGLTTREYTATAGLNWSGGGLIAAYKDVSADAIHARQRDYTRYLADPTTIYPENDSRSVLLGMHQSLGDVAELRLDALRSTREQVSSFFLSGLPQYYRIAPETTATWVSPGIEFHLPNDWTFSVAASWGKDESIYRQTLENITTGASTLLVLNCFCNEMRTYEVGSEGPLFALPGGDARLAVGAGYRSNEFRQVAQQGIGILDVRGDESSRFSYAEISLPLVDADSKIGGIERLLLTAAARSEDYDSFGRVTTPQFGVIYGPSADFSLKGSWGRSFKAPTLYQTHNSVTALLRPAAVLGGTGYPGDATAIYLQGGNRELKPERAQTWTASLAFHPRALPNLQAELTWFDIDYRDRVVFPFANASQGLSNPVYVPFVEYSPTAESQAEVIAVADSFINSTGMPYDPGAVVAILHGRFANVLRQRINGVDLSGSYRFDLVAGQLTIRGSASWLDSSQQLTHSQDSADLAGTLFNPAKINSRIGAVLNKSGFTVSTFVNYTSGVKDTVNDVDGASFTTFDTTLRYLIGERDTARAEWEIALSAQNMFNRDPPFRKPASLIYQTPYDPTNYSAVGRYLSLAVSRYW